MDKQKSSLPEPRQHLVQLMQAVNFGRIEGLVIKSGQPVLDPPPRIIREYRFPGDNSPRAELSVEDFELKSQVVELFHCIDDLRDSVIKVLEVRHGLPFRMSMEDAA